GAGTRRPGAAAREAIALPPEAQQRFEGLRAWRTRIAREHGVPAYVIFHDATLREIAQRQPQSMDELAGISGVGVRKREAYGMDVLACVAEA
ncbi:MAG TPA: HRDC domain-containing protein, partial [Castellaniella sp.]|nr:HRDC domain-containing protein [Castellaniella sp.]